jgi:exodeoxyribonuclease III
MRIVIWNCNMALAAKMPAVMALNPDVAVISECADPTKRSDAVPGVQTSVWVGENSNKGLGVFSFSDRHQLRLCPSYDQGIRWVAPVHVEGMDNFRLLAVWARSEHYRKSTPGPVLQAMDCYRSFLADGPSLMAGDFNHNRIWDRAGSSNNHQSTVDRLRDEHGLVSLYHHCTGEAQGNESTPTIYWMKKEKSYHIDYCFVPEVWRSRSMTLTVGKREDWLAHSDHMPLLLDVDLHG